MLGYRGDATPAEIVSFKRILERYSIPEPNTGCYLWTAAATDEGYGRLTCRAEGKRTVLAHRAAFMVAYGRIAEDKCVCHKCDVPYCVNPEHLFLGSHADNQADKIAKGRQAQGLGNGRCKVSPERAAAILVDARQNATVAREHGVDPKVIRDIKSGKHWTARQ